MSLKYNVNTEIQYTKNNYYEKPEGWVIMDSWNNPFFPIQNTKNIMTSEFNLPELRKIFHMEYNGRPEDLFLPWHWTIEIVNEKPFVNSDFYTGLALSENPQSPQGVCMFVEVLYNPNGDNYHLGRRINWEELPEVVKEAVVERL